MIRKVFYVVVTLFCLAWLGKHIAAPAYAYLFLKDDYMKLSSQCANAMDETWFVEQDQRNNLEKSAQIHLLVCHEYDKTRKKMLMLGLSENILAYLGLKALETGQQPASRIIEQHRFQNR